MSNMSQICVKGSKPFLRQNISNSSLFFGFAPVDVFLQLNGNKMNPKTDMTSAEKKGYKLIKLKVTECSEISYVPVIT